VGSPARGATTTAAASAATTSSGGGPAAASSAAGPAGPATAWHPGHHASVRQELLLAAAGHGPDRGISATAGGHQGATADHQDLEQSTEFHLALLPGLG
jgi:hypothetical protein